MKKNLTDLVFILDRSGSMHGLEKDTVEGFNGMIEKQRDGGEMILVTTVLFDDTSEILHDRTDIDVLFPITEREYYVRGCTALLDAIGNAITKIENAQKHAMENGKAGKTIFIITTDGHENASREYSYDRISKMIEAKKEIGWEFIFMGANMDAVKEASKMGIASERAVTFRNDSRGVRLNYSVMADAVAAMRTNPCEKIDGSWKSAIEEDFGQRS